MRPRDLLLVLLALASASGCARTLVARAPVLYPAAVPVRSFPSVWVVGGALPEGDLGARLTEHLKKGGGDREVRRVELSELEPLREAGEISPLTLVVVIEAGLASEVDERYDVVPVQYCDFYWGCFTQYQSVYSATPQVEGEVLLTVYEGPTARVLQSERFRALALAPDDDEVRKQVVDELGRQLERAIDVLKSEVQVSLEPVEELPTVGEALALVEKGDWAGGRALLEQAAKQLGGQPREVQARVWYDLGIARWVAPGERGLTQEAYEAARRALSLAAERAGNERYDGALAGLERARARQAILEEQRRATVHNFALRDASAGSR